MNIIKRIGLILLSSIILTININNCVVMAYTNDPIEQSIVEFTGGILKGYNKLLRYAGIIIDAGIEASRSYGNFVKARLIALGLLESDATDEDVKEFFDQNISTDGENVTYSPQMVTYIKNEINDIFNNYGFRYVYSIDLNLNVAKFQDAVFYAKLSQMLSTYENAQANLWVVTQQGKSYFVSFNKDIEYAFVYWKPYSGQGINYYDVSCWNFNTWNQLNPLSNNDFSIFEYDNNTQEFIDAESINLGYNTTNQLFGVEPSTNLSYLAGNYNYFLSKNGNKVYKMYATIDDMKSGSVGQQRYYVSDSYNDFSQVTTGSYNTTNDSHNITYGDITTYINKYYDDNGTNPNPTEIYIYINNNIPDSDPSNPDNPSGGNGGTGGSGGNATATATANNGNVNVTINNNPSITLGLPTLSGNGVSGNTVSGNGISGGVDNIFGFISYLGQVLGNLIKNVGNALVDLVEGIAEIIASIFEAIPNVFNDFMTGVFGWLPAELRALIVLAISAMLIVGIIKLIRG